MSIRFTIKRNDTGPALVLDLFDALGVAVDLTTAASAEFHMTTRAHVQKIKAAAVISSDPATKNRVTYNWLPTDTDTAGVYLGEIQVTFGDGVIETFPNADDLQVIVVKDLL